MEIDQIMDVYVCVDEMTKITISNVDVYMHVHVTCVRMWYAFTCMNIYYIFC
jgi:hypothetical protein